MVDERVALGTIEIEVDDDLSYICKMRATFDHDPNYGSDLDNHRGTPRDFLQDIEVLEVTASTTGKIALLPSDRAAELMERAEKECHDWKKE